ncbi:Phosphatase DCR2 [Dirofilaria immitis]
MVGAFIAELFDMHCVLCTSVRLHVFSTRPLLHRYFDKAVTLFYDTLWQHFILYTDDSVVSMCKTAKRNIAKESYKFAAGEIDVIDMEPLLIDLCVKYQLCSSYIPNFYHYHPANLLKCRCECIVQLKHEKNQISEKWSDENEDRLLGSISSN